MKFDPGEVSYGRTGSASMTGRNFDRRTQRRTERIEATHRPTGLTVVVEHGPDYLSKSRWKEVRAELTRSATAKLRAIVEGFTPARGN